MANAERAESDEKLLALTSSLDGQTEVDVDRPDKP